MFGRKSGCYSILRTEPSISSSSAMNVLIKEHRYFYVYKYVIPC